MITKTSMLHPSFQKNIRAALWLAKLESKKTGCRSVQYVQNRNGRNTLRLDVYDGKLTSVYASGHSSKDFVSIVLEVLT